MESKSSPPPGKTASAVRDGFLGRLRGSSRSLVLAALLGAAAFTVSLSYVRTTGLGDETVLGGDAVFYDRGGRGIHTMLTHPLHYLGILWGAGLSDEERIELGLENRYNSGLLRSPTYVVFLGLLYTAGGHHLAVVGTAQSFLVGLTVFVTCLVAAQLLGLWPALAAGLIAAVYASFAYFASLVLTETMALFLVTCTVALLVQVHSRRNPRWAFWLGVAVMLLGLCRITFQYLIPVIAAVLILAAVRAGDRRKLWRFAAGAAVVLAPWLVATGLIFGKPVLSAPTTETVYTLYRGNYVPEDGWENDGAGDYWSPELRAAVDVVGGGRLTEAAYKDAWKRTVKADPPRYAAFVLRKASRLWSLPAYGWPMDLGWTSLPGEVVLHRLLVILGVLGAGLALRELRRFWYVPLFLAYITGVHALTHVESRFVVPFMPIMVVLAVALVAGAFRMRSRVPALIRRPAVRGALVALVILYVLSAFLDLGRLVAGFGTGSVSGLHVIAVLFRVAPLAAVALLLYLVFRTESVRWRALAGGVVPAAAIAAAWAGSAGMNPGWREWSCRLDSDSQAAVQEIALPADLKWDMFRAAALQIDMLPDLDAEVPVTVLVDGDVVKTYPRGLESFPEKFQFSKELEGNRWDRLSQRMDGILNDMNLDDAGLEYYRQWYLVPLDLASLRGKERVRVEVRIGEPGGGGSGTRGWVDVFGDYPEPGGSAGRAFFGPGFGRSPYETSTYKLRMYAPIRRAADYRLYREIPLASPEARPEFVDGSVTRDRDLSPSPGRQAGEYRIRLDLALKGGYYFTTDPNTGAPQVSWVLEPTEDMKPVEPASIQSFEAKKDLYFDGHLIF